VNRKKAEDNS